MNISIPFGLSAKNILNSPKIRPNFHNYSSSNVSNSYPGTRAESINTESDNANAANIPANGLSASHPGFARGSGRAYQNNSQFAHQVHQERQQSVFSSGVFNLNGATHVEQNMSTPIPLWTIPDPKQTNPLATAAGAIIAPLGYPLGALGNILGQQPFHNIGNWLVGEPIGLANKINQPATQKWFANFISSNGPAIGAFFAPMAKNLASVPNGQNVLTGFFGGIIENPLFNVFNTEGGIGLSRNPAAGAGFAGFLSNLLTSPQENDAFMHTASTITGTGAWDPNFTGHLQEVPFGRQLLGVWLDLSGRAYIHMLQRQGNSLANNPQVQQQLMAFMGSTPSKDFQDEFSNWAYLNNPQYMSQIYNALAGTGTPSDNALLHDFLSESAINAIDQGVPAPFSPQEFASLGINITQHIPQTQPIQQFYATGYQQQVGPGNVRVSDGTPQSP